MKKWFRIDRYTDEVYVLNQDGEMLTVEELKALLAEIKEGQPFALAHEANTRLPGMIESSLVHFPTGYELPKQALPCVYFATWSHFPNLIKIGYSENLKGRRKVLQNELTGKVKIICYMEHAEAKAMENYLHVVLHEANNPIEKVDRNDRVVATYWEFFRWDEAAEILRNGYGFEIPTEVWDDRPTRARTR